MNDVLLPIGSLIKATAPQSTQTLYMIIGKRIINHETLNAWDYVCVPFEDGFKREMKSCSSHYDNFYYCNHTDIEHIQYEFQLGSFEPPNPGTIYRTVNEVPSVILDIESKENLYQ